MVSYVLCLYFMISDTCIICPFQQDQKSKVSVQKSLPCFVFYKYSAIFFGFQFFTNFGEDGNCRKVDPLDSSLLPLPTKCRLPLKRCPACKVFFSVSLQRRELFFIYFGVAFTRFINICFFNFLCYTKGRRAAETAAHVKA